MTRRKQFEKSAGSYYSRKFTWLNSCVYCGMAYECLDHVFPISLAAGIDLEHERVRQHLRHCLYIVPACQSCNSIASARAFSSIKDKREYIQKRLMEKNKTKLRTVMWSMDEIEELGHTMKAEVLKMLNNRYVLEKRIMYPNLPNSISSDIIELFIAH